jgi:hypothetical protein
MFLHITAVTIGLSFLYGYLLRISSAGGSEARAHAPKVSMIKLIQSIITALSGESLRIAEETKQM